MKPFIVVSDGMEPNCFEKLKNESRFDVHPLPKLQRDELKDLIKKADGLILRSKTHADEDLLKEANNLKIIIRAGGGTDNIDKEYCKSKGIKVCNTPGANSNSAAEHAIGLMFSLYKHIPFAHNAMINGHWEKDRYSKGFELTNKKIGIIGFGKVGQSIAKLLSGLEPEILFFDQHFKSESPFSYAKSASFNEIIESCDIITIHVPKTEETTNLISKNELSKMKPNAILINCARGGIVNEDDLYQSLKNEEIFGAALDVFNNEPLEKDSKLRSLDNLVLTPHLGASTAEAQIRVSEMAVEQICSFFINGVVKNQVN